jgi:hypothetical protein
VELTEYPNAHHAFDSPLLPTTPRVAKNAQTVRRCIIREEATAKLVNTTTGAPFAYTDACVERDPHVGHDAAATEAALQSVRNFLKLVFKL